MWWWSGNSVSLLGTYVSAMAFPLLAVYSTGSVLNAGIIAAAGRIGGLLTLLWGGRSRTSALARPAVHHRLGSSHQPGREQLHAAARGPTPRARRFGQVVGVTNAGVLVGGILGSLWPARS